MAKKETKMISIETMDEILADHIPVVEIAEFYGQEIIVQKRIPFLLMRELVQKVADACFSDEGEYMPEIRDFALRLCCMEAYTNIRLPQENVEHQYEIVSCTELWRSVAGCIDEDQLEQICDAIHDRIDARLDNNRAAFEREVNKMIEALDEAGKQVTEVFGSISAEDLQNLIQALGENGVDEEKIVQAVVAEQNKVRDNVVELTVKEAAAAAEDGTDGE